jgi:hypothetical protein
MDSRWRQMHHHGSSAAIRICHNTVGAITMTKHQDVAKALKARLSELKRGVAEIDRELHTQLSADSEEQAIDLENQRRSKRLKSLEFRKFVGLNRRYGGSRKALTVSASSAVQILTPSV